MPWLLYCAVHAGQAYPVSNAGLFCSVVILFVMLLVVMVTIALCRCRMNKSLGVVMFSLYVVFVTITLVLEYNILDCPFVVAS